MNILKNIKLRNALRVKKVKLRNALRRLESPDTSIRRLAAAELGYLQEEEAVKPLGELLLPPWSSLLPFRRRVEASSKEDPVLQIAAARALGSIRSARGIPFLLPTLQHINDGVRVAAFEAPQQIDASLRRESVQAAIQEAIPKFIMALCAPDVAIRKAAASALSHIDPHWPQSEAAKVAAPRLVYNYNFQKMNNDVRRAAVEVLAQMVPHSITLLVELLHGVNYGSKDLIVSVLIDVVRSGEKIPIRSDIYSVLQSSIKLLDKIKDDEIIIAQDIIQDFDYFFTSISPYLSFSSILIKRHTLAEDGMASAGTYEWYSKKGFQLGHRKDKRGTINLLESGELLMLTLLYDKSEGRDNDWEYNCEVITLEQFLSIPFVHKDTVQNCCNYIVTEWSAVH